MSITISIDNNTQYVDNNCPDLIQVDVYRCQCAEFADDGKATPDCWECRGTGEIRFKNYPYELNMANANFRTTFAALGLTTEDYGELDARVILKALARTPTDLILRGESEESNQNGPTMYFAGIHEGQANRYQEEIRRIAMEAERREEKVTWG